LTQRGQAGDQGRDPERDAAEHEDHEDDAASPWDSAPRTALRGIHCQEGLIAADFACTEPADEAPSPDPNPASPFTAVSAPRHPDLGDRLPPGTRSHDHLELRIQLLPNGIRYRPRAHVIELDLDLRRLPGRIELVLPFEGVAVCPVETCSAAADRNCETESLDVGVRICSVRLDVSGQGFSRERRGGLDRPDGFGTARSNVAPPFASESRGPSPTRPAAPRHAHGEALLMSKSSRIEGRRPSSSRNSTAVASM
jgi:hypothetical protein